MVHFPPASIDDFTRYSKDSADEGTRFIDADNMRAVSVLNRVLLMSPVTQITPPLSNWKKTAPFSALLSVNGERNSQEVTGRMDRRLGRLPCGLWC